MPIGKDVNLEEIAKKTEGYSGADLEALCREAALNAIRRNKNKVTREDFEEALKKIKPSISPMMIERYRKFAEERE